MNCPKDGHRLEFISGMNPTLAKKKRSKCELPAFHYQPTQKLQEISCK